MTVQEKLQKLVKLGQEEKWDEYDNLVGSFDISAKKVENLVDAVEFHLEFGRTMEVSIQKALKEN